MGTVENLRMLNKNLGNLHLGTFWEHVQCSLGNLAQTLSEAVPCNFGTLGNSVGTFIWKVPGTVWQPLLVNLCLGTLGGMGFGAAPAGCNHGNLENFGRPAILGTLGTL